MEDAFYGKGELGLRDFLRASHKPPSRLDPKHVQRASRT